MKFTKFIGILTAIFLLSASQLANGSFKEISAAAYSDNSDVTAIAQTVLSIGQADGTAAYSSAEYTEPSLGAPYGLRTTDFEYNAPVDYPISYMCADEDNLISDSSFENGGNWNQSSLFGAGVVSVVSATDSSTAHSGNKMLKYSAVGLERDETRSNMFFDVEPDTEYYFTVFVRGEKWSDTNKCDMYLGIVNPETGKFVPQGFGINNKRHDENRQYSVTYDNEWHIVRGVVNSGSATRLGIGFCGGNAVAYIDDMYFFKSENKVLYKSAKLNIASAQVITDAPKKTECAAAANLFKNYDISDVSGDTFWTSGKGFFPTIKLADTGTTMGNAIYYCENTYGTGYPKGTYYIKWIDVKVNTDYTFAADYRVIKAGDGWFGLINGSEFLPSRIKGFTFAAVTEGSRETAAVTFNTGGYTKIGFVVCDDGGEAYINNLRLFENTVTTEKSLTPSATNNVTYEDGVYTFSTYTGNSVTFDYEIRAGYTYILSYDYKGHNVTDRGQNPAVSAVSSKNHSENRKLTDSGQIIPLDIGSHTDSYVTYITVFTGDELLKRSEGGNGKYLMINAAAVAPACSFKNLKIIEYQPLPNEIVPTAVKGYKAPTVDGDGNVCYETDYEQGKENDIWSKPYDHGLAFNYEIESAYYYCLTFEYKGDLSLNGGNTPVSARTNNAFTDLRAGSSANAVRFDLPQSSTWTAGRVILSGEELLAAIGNDIDGLANSENYKYLTVISAFTKAYSLRNFRIERVLRAAGSTGFQEAAVDEEGYICYKTLGTKNDYYEVGDNSLVFDYKIEKEYNYLLSYDYKYIYDDACGSTPISAYVSMSSTKPFAGGVSDKAFKLNTSTNGWWNNWASDSTVLSGHALLNLNAGEYLTIISTYTKPYTLRNIRISKHDYRDVNFDSEVNATDLGLLRKELLGIDTAAEITDINGDRQTDILDLVCLKKAMSN